MLSTLMSPPSLPFLTCLVKGPGWPIALPSDLSVRHWHPSTFPLGCPKPRLYLDKKPFEYLNSLGRLGDKRER